MGLESIDMCELDERKESAVNEYLGDDDLESVYRHACDDVEMGGSVVLQGARGLSPRGDLFCAGVVVGGGVEVGAMLDGGSMASALSSGVLPLLLCTGVLGSPSLGPAGVVNFDLYARCKCSHN